MAIPIHLNAGFGICMNLLASSPHLIMFYRKYKNIVNISCAAHIQASFFLSGEPNLSGLCNKEALHILCKLVICTGSRIHTTEAQLRFPFHPSFLILKMQQLLPLFPRLSLYPFGCAICLPFLYFAFARRQMERGSNDAELRSPGREGGRGKPPRMHRVFASRAAGAAG